MLSVKTVKGLATQISETEVIPQLTLDLLQASALTAIEMDRISEEIDKGINYLTALEEKWRSNPPAAVVGISITQSTVQNTINELKELAAIFSGISKNFN